MLGRDQRERVCPSGNGAWGCRKAYPCLTGEVRGGKRSRSESEAFWGVPSRIGWGEPKPEGLRALRAPGAAPLSPLASLLGVLRVTRWFPKRFPKRLPDGYQKVSKRFPGGYQNGAFFGSENGPSRSDVHGVLLISYFERGGCSVVDIPLNHDRCSLRGGLP